MSGQIFINYRRDDASHLAGRLYDRIAAHFPKNQIFIDVDNLDPGIDFVEAIEQSVGACDVLIAVIGNRWLISSEAEGSRRLDNPDDFVRLEIATALKRNVRVIPVLVDGAPMPRASDLPDDLKSLVRRNAVEISHTRFNADSERLVAALERVFEKTATEQRERKEKARLEAERRETELKERLEAERRQKEERDRLEAEQREKERLDAEQRERERREAERREHEKEERLEHVPQSQLPSPVAPSIAPAQPEADKPSAETPNVVHPAPPKAAESEHDKPPPHSSGGIGRKSPSKQAIAFLGIAAVLVVAGLIYLATRPSKSPPPQPAPIPAVTPSPLVRVTPTVEEKVSITPQVAVQPTAQPTAPVAVAIPKPLISATPSPTPSAAELLTQAKGYLDTKGKVKLTIESWRNDDLKIWRDTIIPAFTEKNPNIEVVFAPTAPTEYNAGLHAKLKAGTAGDLIACRPFDTSLAIYNAGQLVALNDLPGMENFSEVAKAAWSTDDGKTTFAVPMASVIHGFLYNKAIFKELGLTVPETEKDFLAVLDKIKANGKYIPLVMGTKDQWESATMGYQNIGPTLWGGESGRKGLIDGSEKYNKGGFLAAFEALAKWKPYLPTGYQALAYPDSQNLFAQGRGAIYPAGSWDIGIFHQMNPKLEMGAFKPYSFDGKSQSVVDDHPDIALGLNAASQNKEAAKTFLSWVASDEFAQLYANALPGFFPLANVKYSLQDPVAQEFVSWRKDGPTSFRCSYQILSRNANPNNENDLWNACAQILNGTETPQQAADFVQKDLASWYKPQQTN